MRTLLLVVAALAAVGTQASAQSSRYPSLDRYLMPPEAEADLARTAAPATISSRATIKVLTGSGYQVAHTGDNGFVCLVMRGFTGPTYTPAHLRDIVYDATIRAPICFDPEAARTVMPFYELRTTLGLAGKTPDEIARAVETAYVSGQLPKREAVTFGYMWSAEQHLGAGVGRWHPHMMVYAPYYKNSMLGDNGFGEPLPAVVDDGGTPFAVIVIPVDDKLAIKGGTKSSADASRPAVAHP
jgi:hypothetical protein